MVHALYCNLLTYLLSFYKYEYISVKIIEKTVDHKMQNYSTFYLPVHSGYTAAVWCLELMYS